MKEENKYDVILFYLDFRCFTMSIFELLREKYYRDETTKQNMFFDMLQNFSVEREREREGGERERKMSLSLSHLPLKKEFSFIKNSETGLIRGRKSIRVVQNI